MGASCVWRWDVMPVGATDWTNISADVVAVAGMSLSYGIDGNGPLENISGTGECSFTLRNDAGASHGTQGYYSPAHASVWTGWTFGIPCRVSAYTGTPASMTSITRSGSAATATTSAPHSLATGDYVTIAGAAQAAYNGVYQVTYTGASTFTYTVVGAPASPATGTITWIRSYVRHRGKLYDIRPDAGAYLKKHVVVTSYDGMRDLYEADVRQVATQIGQTESAILGVVLDAVPATSQPVARDLDIGVDAFPIALDDLEGGAPAASVIQDLVTSSFGLAVMRGDGTFAYINRHSRQTATSQYTFTNTMHGLEVPSSLEGVWNRFRIILRPRQISDDATDELYSMPSGTYIEVGPGITTEVWTPYTDPADRQVPVGGLDVVTTLVAGTHWQATANQDGSGADYSADFTVSLTAFATTGLWSFENTGSNTAYITTQKVIGRAVRSPGPQTYETSTTQDYGDRSMTIDTRYQTNAPVAKDAGVYLCSVYDSLAHQVEAIEFIANDSSDFMTQALAREPGDRITLTETVTGLSSVGAIVHKILLTLTPGPWVVCRFGLAPVTTLASGWTLDTGALDSTTALIF